MVRFEVNDDRTTATRNRWRTGHIPHDRRRTLRIRKRAESEHRTGGAVADRARSRQGGLAETTAPVRCIRSGVHKVSAASAALTDSSFVQKSTLLKEKWLHGSAADNPSGKTSSHTWQCSPHPSGSSEQRQTICSPHVATNAMQPMTASATQSFNLLFLFTPANCTILPLPRQITRNRRSGVCKSKRLGYLRSLLQTAHIHQGFMMMTP